MAIDSNIHYSILERVRAQITEDLITSQQGEDDAPDDEAIAGSVVIGPLLDSPLDYEESRISIELFNNDPEHFDSWSWVDEPVEDMLEIGQGMTWRRRFSLMARALLVNTMEVRGDAYKTACLIKSRLEKSLMDTSFGDLLIDGERVTGRIFSENIRSKMLQSGGPESWDFEFWLRFEVKTTKVYTI